MSSKMTKQEKQDWLDLCSYIKLQILEYSKEMKFPKELALRLKGLSDGKFIANKYIPAQAKYDFKTILITCKICRPKIVSYLKNNQTKIKNESHKINLILMFVEKEINDVYIRLRENSISQEKIQDIDMKNQTNLGAEYQSKTKQENKRLENLW